MKNRIIPYEGTGKTTSKKIKNYLEDEDYIQDEEDKMQDEEDKRQDGFNC